MLLPLWLLNVKRRMNATRVRRLRNEDSESDVLPRRAVKALGFFRHKADERKHGAATPSGKGLSVINLRQAWRRFITLKPSFLEIQVPKEGLSIILLSLTEALHSINPSSFTSARPSPLILANKKQTLICPLLLLD